MGAFVWWTAMMFLLVRHHRPAGAVEGAGGLLTLLKKDTAETRWYGIFHDGRKVGCGEVAVSADAMGESLSYRIDYYVRLFAAETVQAQGDLILHEPGGLSSFSFQLRSGRRMLFLNGKAEGESLLIDYDFGEFARQAAAAAPTFFREPSGRVKIPLAWDKGGPLPVRDEGEEVVDIRGVLSTVRRYALPFAGGEARLMVGAQGTVLRADLPGGVTVIQEPRTLAERAERDLL